MNAAAVVCLTLLAVLSGDPEAARGETVRLNVAAQPLAQDMPRIGLNLGSWNSWGAEQLMSNILKNPGFEAPLDRQIVAVRHAEAFRFSDSETWLKRDDGFWAGASYDIRTGQFAGQRGNLSDSRAQGRHGLPEYFAEQPLALRDSEVVVLSRSVGGGEIPFWRTAPALPGALRAVPQERRPGSPGSQAVALQAGSQAVALLAYFDDIAPRAGKLLPVAGKWRFAVWARADGERLRLTVRFDRKNAPPFLNQEIVLTPNWRRYEFVFQGRDDGPAEILELRLTLAGGGAGRMLLDDAELGPVSAGPFRKEVVDTLKQLRPGYLRDWQNQLGDTLENRLADTFARRPSRYRPGEQEIQFGYGLGEFLDLCKEVGAAPWIVVPTTFGDAEFAGLGRYLAARRDGFPEIVVEFGNENWNPLFRPAGIINPAMHAEAARRAFAILAKQGGAALRLRFTVNAQYANPSAPETLKNLTQSADLVAVAPYFHYTQKAGASPLSSLFEEAAHFAVWRKHGLKIAVYEVNLHTTGGNADAHERNVVVTSAAAGSALAKRILDALLGGVKHQALYSLAGFDAYADDRSLVRLWGITRDLASPGHLRPTGLALELLNRAVGGELYPVTCQGPATACGKITAAAFRDHGQWRLIAVSSGETAIEAEVMFPGGAIPAQSAWIAAASPWVNNEDGEKVRIKSAPIGSSGQVVRLNLPPLGLAALLPGGH